MEAELVNSFDYYKLLQACWQFFLASLSVYVLVKLVYFLITIYQSDKKECLQQDVDDESAFTSECSDEDTEAQGMTEDFPVNYIELDYRKYTKEQELKKSEEFYKLMNRRRSVMEFKDEEIPLDVMKNIVKTAGTAPSIGHTEPWTYILIKAEEMKARIRKIVEESSTVYKQNEPKSDQKKVDCSRDHLTEAPYLVLVFTRDIIQRTQKMFTNGSVYSAPLSVGILLAAIQYSGLVSLISIPANCNKKFKQLLKRPKTEKFLMLLSVGYPKEKCHVPDLPRKDFKDICHIVE